MRVVTDVCQSDLGAFILIIHTELYPVGAAALFPFQIHIGIFILGKHKMTNFSDLVVHNGGHRCVQHGTEHGGMGA